MNHWLGIALIAYLTGAVIEGVHAASQLSGSISEFDEEAEGQSLETPNSRGDGWHVFAVIAGVSIRGAFLWPCRLIHRSMKGDQAA